MSSLAIMMIRAYQLFLGWLTHGACRFHPTCSEYAVQCFEHLPPTQALLLTGKRLLRCHPWCDGGLDPAPEKA